MSTDTTEKAEKKTRRIHIAMTERAQQMVEDIKVEKGFSTVTQVVLSAIAEAHRKTFPAYVGGVRGGAPAEPKLSPEEAARKEGLRVCAALDGRVVGNHCEFYRYSGKSRYEMKVPVSLLTDATARTQYSPSRERVEELQAAGMTDYQVR